MGSTGAFLKTGGFGEQGWEDTKKRIAGIKVLRKLTEGNEKQSLPPYSNTPGTAYILLNSDGSFNQYRQYGENRYMEFDVDYGKHGNEVSLHIHYHTDKVREEPDIIASKKRGIVDKKLYNKFKKFLKGVDL